MTTTTTLTFAPTASGRAARRQMQRQKLIPKGATITDWNDTATITICSDLDLLKRLLDAASHDLMMTQQTNRRGRSVKAETQQKRDEAYGLQAGLVRAISERVNLLDPPATVELEPMPATMPAPTPIRPAVVAPDAPQPAILDAETFARSVAASVTQKGRNLWASFDAKPSAGVRDQLKSYGFRWAAKRSAWWLDTTRATAQPHAADIAAG